MTPADEIITVAICVLGTMATRFLPFLLFSENRPTPKYISYLGKALPPAVFGMLVVYCLKNVEVLGESHGIPEFIAVAVTAVLHFWKGKMLLSVAAGTVIYMFLVQFVF